MAKKSTLRCVFDDLVTDLTATLSKNRIFLQNRPNVKSEGAPMEKFCVISLPVSINDYVVGNERTLLETAGVFYLFTQARSNNTLNLDASDFIDDVMKRFPIKGTYCVASNPSLRLNGADEYGYQVAIITFDLRCRWKAFNEENKN
jgi:hypothetical protein